MQRFTHDVDGNDVLADDKGEYVRYDDLLELLFQASKSGDNMKLATNLITDLVIDQTPKIK